MKTYLISYDLLNPGADYARLHDAIKGLANGYWHHLESVWLVNSNLSCVEIRDKLKGCLDTNDKLLVVELGALWATYNIPAAGTDWLKNHSHLPVA